MNAPLVPPIMLFPVLIAQQMAAKMCFPGNEIKYIEQAVHLLNR